MNVIHVLGESVLGDHFSTGFDCASFDFLWVSLEQGPLQQRERRTRVPLGEAGPGLSQGPPRAREVRSVALPGVPSDGRF